MLKALSRTAICAALLLPIEAQALEYTYVSGDVWAVTQSVPWGAVTESGPKPTCNLSTRIWDDKRVDIQYVLINRDTIEPQLTVHSDDWKLPIGRKTNVTLSTVSGPMPVAATAITETTLQGVIQADEGAQGAYVTFQMTIQYLLNTRGRGAGFNVRFAGNEPPWPVSAPEPYEAHQVKRAIDKCTADLRRKAATYYPADKNAAGTGPTSPFTEEAEAGQQTKPNQDSIEPDSQSHETSSQNATAEPPPSQRAVAASDGTWQFSYEEEDGGPLCSVETEQAGVRVGFIGQPGASISGFVSGVFDKDTRAAWTVDGGASASSSGSLNDYFDWHMFDELPSRILDDIADGQELRISEFGGRGTTVKLHGARDAISSFKACMAKK
jgi:hypothetical protein